MYFRLDEECTLQSKRILKRSWDESLQLQSIKYKVYSYNKPTTQLLIAQQSPRLLSNPAEVRLRTENFQDDFYPTLITINQQKG